ncbi:LOW QUALITY PROTEIN: hypothetical protein HZS_5119 [Henneguya salminicola]|nr:LOW QUALITY PROTEIN: hypothetical protein HZS_5119 [Henneguya salminicola]
MHVKNWDNIAIKISIKRVYAKVQIIAIVILCIMENNVRYISLIRMLTAIMALKIVILIIILLNNVFTIEIFLPQNKALRTYVQIRFISRPMKQQK